MTGREETTIRLENKLNNMIGDNELLREFYLSMSVEGRAPSTCVQYIGNVKKMLKDLGDKDVRYITTSDINYLFHTYKKGTKPQTYLHTLYQSLKKFYDFLLANGYVEKDVIKAVPKPKMKASKDIHRDFLAPEEYQDALMLVRLHASTPELAIRNTVMTRMFLEIGIRKTALTEINVCDVDFDEKVVRVTDKGNKTTDFPLSDDLLDMIDELIDAYKLPRNGEVPLFCSGMNRKRIAPYTIGDIVKEALDGLNGKHITPHKLRGSFATNLYNSCGDIRLVQQCMNHADIATTQIYVQPDERNRWKARDIVSKMF